MLLLVAVAVGAFVSGHMLQTNTRGTEDDQVSSFKMAQINAVPC